VEERLVPLVKPQLAPSSMFPPPSWNAADTVLQLFPELAARIVLVSFTDPVNRAIPPPWATVLPLKVLLITVSVPPRTTAMAPPNPLFPLPQQDGAALPLKVLLATVTAPPLV